MKRLMTLAMAAASLLTAPHFAQAEDCCECFITEGFYLGAFGGATWYRDHFLETDTPAGALGQVRRDLGFNLGGFLGYRCCNGLRLEAELAFRDNDFDRVILYHSAGSGETSMELTNGEFESLSFMGNIIYECTFMACDTCLRPYFGVGFGAAKLETQFSTTVDTVTLDRNDDKTQFAYQFIIGIAYPYNDCIDMSFEYRYFNADIDDYTVDTGSEVYRLHDSLANHSLMLTLRTIIGSLW